MVAQSITPTTPLCANESYGIAIPLVEIVCCFALETVNTHRGGHKSFAHFQTKTPKSVIRSDMTARQLQTTGLPLLNTARSFVHSIAGTRYYAAHHQIRVLGAIELPKMFRSAAELRNGTLGAAGRSHDHEFWIHAVDVECFVVWKSFSSLHLANWATCRDANFVPPNLALRFAPHRPRFRNRRRTDFNSIQLTRNANSENPVGVICTCA